MNKRDRDALNRAIATVEDLANSLLQGAEGNLFPIGHVCTLRIHLNILRIWAKRHDRPGLSKGLADDAEILDKLVSKVFEIFRSGRPLSRREDEVDVPTEDGCMVFEFREAVNDMSILLNGLLEDMKDSKNKTGKKRGPKPASVEERQKEEKFLKEWEQFAKDKEEIDGEKARRKDFSELKGVGERYVKLVIDRARARRREKFLIHAK